MSTSMSPGHQALRMVRATAPELMGELEALDRRADDVTLKAGATLAFDGLLIAAGLVVLSAEQGTNLHVPVGAPVALVGAGALVILFMASVICLTAIGRGRARLTEHAEAVIVDYDGRLKRHEGALVLASFMTFVGAVGFLAAFGWAIGRSLAAGG